MRTNNIERSRNHDQRAIEYARQPVASVPDHGATGAYTMSDEPKDRPPKFEFVARPRVYGDLDTRRVLIVCRVIDKKLAEAHYPLSWAEGVARVGNVEDYRRRFAEREAARAAHAEWRLAYDAWRERHQVPRTPSYVKETQSTVGRKEWEVYNEAADKAKAAGDPEPQPKHNDYVLSQPVEQFVLVALNDTKESYEIVYDPHGLEGIIDPMMLLNFRRRLR